VPQPVQQTITVTVCRTEARQETVPVTHVNWTTEQRSETFTVMRCQTTPYQATRTVAVCVPYQETVTVTRCVPQYVQKQVMVGGCGDCGDSGGAAVACCDSGHHKRGLFRR
jgi:hypothetical protein